VQVPTHILSGWCVANCFRLSPRQRFLSMAAATMADVDGLGIIGKMDWYWAYHHKLAHNLFFGVIACAILVALSRRRWLPMMGLYLGLFHLHLLMDLFGSGPDWGIAYLWPFSGRIFTIAYAWEFSGWQNRTTALLLLIWALAVVWAYGRTPLEWPMPRLDRQLVRALCRWMPGGMVSWRPVQSDGRVHGVVAAMRNHNGRWLVIRRSRHVSVPLKICFPGGGMEAGESQEAALIREMTEELGARITPVRCVWRWDFPNKPLTLWGWLATLHTPDLHPDPQEVAEVLWLNSREILAHPDGIETNAAFVAALDAAC